LLRRGATGSRDQPIKQKATKGSRSTKRTRGFQSVAKYISWTLRRIAPRYTRDKWERFWSRANALLGYDHTTLLGPRDANRIGDGMSVAGWIRLLERAGFELIDVLLRDADQVVIGALKSIDPGGR
jgi:hypothetical protein